MIDMTSTKLWQLLYDLDEEIDKAALLDVIAGAQRQRDLKLHRRVVRLLLEMFYPDEASGEWID